MIICFSQNRPTLARLLNFQQQSDRALPETATLSDIFTLFDASQVWWRPVSQNGAVWLPLAEDEPVECKLLMNSMLHFVQ
jgi:hypothetical protein